MMNGNEERYRVILVDDEPIILRSLKAAIPWEELQLDIVGEARNGEAALREIEEKEPHIVISDIRMPVIDGIALMKEVLAANPKLAFIFISGYGEFEYAREALRQGAFDYLLKPIDHDELTDMLKRARKRLDRQKENEQLLHSVQALSLLARERMFAEVLEGHPRPLQQLRWLEHSELEQPYFMAVVRLDDYRALSGSWSAAEKRLWLFAVRNILEEWSMENGALTVFPFQSGEWILLFPSNAEMRRQTLGEDIVYRLQKYAKLSCSVGISRVTKGIDRLSTVYSLADKALYRKFYTGGAGVFLEEEQPASRPGEIKYPKALEDALLESVRTRNVDRIDSLLSELAVHIESSALEKESAERLLTELAIVLHRQFEQLKTQDEWSLDGLLARLHEVGTLSGMLEAFRHEVRVWMDASGRTLAREDGRSIVEKVQRYIEHNYHKDLGIEEAAELADLSVSHFCTLFKQISGYTFLEYVTQCRMEKAKYILRNSNVKVYQIAPMVGYQDPRYFTQVFKKATGQTPSEFREEHLRQAT
ncbi:response regulator [Paenibacillus sp. CN-4]|uniref:response regulator n=1 Tax=Paenibacillus nanchangensis TaxID=3348343 RepID=UPI00397A3BCB